MHWEGTHGVTKERLWVTRRKDRNGIAVLYRGSDGKQICMASTRQFDDVLEEDRFQKALALMTEVGKSFAACEFELDNIYKAREEKYRIMFKSEARKKKRQEMLVLATSRKNLREQTLLAAT